MNVTKTTCGAHRVMGYYYVGGVWLCKGCGQPQSRHETNAETIARKYREKHEQKGIGDE